MEGTSASVSPKQFLQNHPSTYGGYSWASIVLRNASESSLHIRRVYAVHTNAGPDERIIPPHTEGICCIRSCRSRTPNHPSTYGGYMYSLTFHPTHLESSLRIWRVRQTQKRVTSVPRIIPPHTEGTFSCLLSCLLHANHPSAYGGYEKARQTRQRESESSLRIRRVRKKTSWHKSKERIIPPHTEGTPSPGQAFHRTPNHPSAYGGYCLRLHGSRAAQESSLPIRRVRRERRKRN